MKGIKNKISVQKNVFFKFDLLQEKFTFMCLTMEGHNLLTDYSVSNQ